MTIPFQFANSGSPQVIQGTGAPDPFAQLIQSLMQGADLGQRASEERGRNSRSSAELDLEKKKLDIVLADKKSEQIRLKTEGEAIKQMLPVLIQMGAAPQMMGAPQGAQQPQQGVPQPMGLPDVGLVPSGAVRGSQGPKDRFQSIVASLPPEMVGQFVQRYGPMVEAQQAKLDQEAAFDEAGRLTDGLLTPDQAQGFKVARSLFQAGAPKEMWGALMPSAIIALAKGAEELRSIKNKRESDKNATGKLVNLGLLPASQGGPGTEYVVDGATRMYYDYIADVRKDARKAVMERAKQNQADALTGLQGAANWIAKQHPEFTPERILQSLKATPEYAGLPASALQQAALSAPKEVRKLTGPANEQEARYQVLAGSVPAEIAVVNQLSRKGVTVNWKSDLAQVDMKTTATVGAGLGAGAGATIAALASAGLGLPAGAAIGGSVGGGVGAALAGPIQKLGRAAMSDDEQVMNNAMLNIGSAVMRIETGANDRAEEFPRYAVRFFPLSTDSERVKKVKELARNDLVRRLKIAANLPEGMGDAMLRAALSEYDQQLIGAGGNVGAVAAPPTPGRGTGRSF